MIAYIADFLFGMFGTGSGGAAPSTDVILMETGDRLLLETADGILLE